MFSPSMLQTQRMTLAHKMDLTQSCLQSCRETIESLRREIKLDNNSLGHEVINTALSLAKYQIKDPAVYQALLSFVGNEENKVPA